MIVSSKYLKAAQDLLEEVVNVEKGVKLNESVKLKSGSKVAGGSPAATVGEGGSGGETKRAGTEITMAERQEIQMKKAKLVNMLDEVQINLKTCVSYGENLIGKITIRFLRYNIYLTRVFVCF